MNLLASMVIAFSMYSKIPMPHVKWTNERMKYVFLFFPFVGVVIAFLVLGTLWLLHWAGKMESTALLIPMIPLLITGGIHMDGFIDVCDALASHKGREEKLEIMKDPHIGAFAIIYFAMYLLLYVWGVSQLNGMLWFAYSMNFIFMRTLSALSVLLFKKAKSDGLAVAFSKDVNCQMIGIGMIAYIGVIAWILWYVSGAFLCMFVLSIGVFLFVWYYKMAKEKFGGVTGDLAGYFLQTGELVVLLSLAVLSFFR